MLALGLLTGSPASPPKCFSEGTLMTNRQLRFAVALLGFAIVSPATAAVTTYPNRAAWLAAAGTPTGGEDFNGFTADTSVQPASVPIQGANVTADNVPFAAPKNWIDVPPFMNNSWYSVDGTPVLQGEIEDDHWLRITFTKPVTAWAVDMRRPRIQEGATVNIEVYSAADVFLGSIPVPRDHEDGALQFYGFTVSGGTASRLVFSTVTTFGNSVFGLDNIQFVAVPEPTTLTVAASGILALGVFRRRS